MDVRVPVTETSKSERASVACGVKEVKVFCRNIASFKLCRNIASFKLIQLWET